MNLLILFTLIPLLKGQVRNPGKCPEVKPVQNFRKNDFTGRWYTILRYPNPFDSNTKCVTADCEFSRSGKFYQNYTVIRESDDTVVLYNCVATFRKDDNIADFDLEIPQDSGNIHLPQTFIAIDYENYGVFWGCEQHKNYTLSYSWIYSRRRTLSKNYLHKALEAYKRYGLDTNALEKIDQTNCSH